MAVFIRRRGLNEPPPGGGGSTASLAATRLCQSLDPRLLPVKNTQQIFHLNGHEEKNAREVESTSFA